MIGVAGALTLTGCYGASDYPRHRDLSFDGIRVVSSDPTGSVVRVTPEMSWAGDSKDWATFHDVRLIGYSDSNEVVCQERLGNMVGRGPMEPIQLTCSEPPVMLTYAADESPCEEDTLIGVAVYRTDPDGESYWWLDGQRQCDEGLPPDFDRLTG